MVQVPGDWRWSSYRATIGADVQPRWLAAESILERFAPNAQAASKCYVEFVRAGIGQRGPWSELRGQIVLGSAGFLQALAPRLAALQESTETPRAQRLAARPVLARLLCKASLHSRAHRDAAITQAHRIHGYSLSEIARHLCLHYSTVSRIANRAAIQDLTPRLERL
jgi:hypothetical protein